MTNIPGAVFFDWDGTLVDSFAFLHQAHNHVRGLMNIEPLDISVWGEYFGQPREKLYKKLYGENNVETAKGYFESYVLSNHLLGLKPMEGAADLLKALNDVGIPCGVVSNKKRSLIEAEIRNFGWEKYFISVVGAAEAAQDKPSSAPLFLALEKAGLEIPIETVWFVGDTDNDLLCAEGAGCVSVLIAEEGHYKNLLQSHKIQIHHINCASLCDFVLQYNVKPLKLGEAGE